MRTSMHLPVEQQAIREKCFRNGAPYIPFPEKAAEQSICTRFEEVA